MRGSVTRRQLLGSGVALGALLCRDFHLAWRTYAVLKEMSAAA